LHSQKADLLVEVADLGRVLATVLASSGTAPSSVAAASGSPEAAGNWAPTNRESMIFSALLSSEADD
jgi:hypothetical protein